MEFRPSEIAAAVAISVSGDTKTAGEDIFMAIPCFALVHKVKKLTYLSGAHRHKHTLGRTKSWEYSTPTTTMPQTKT